MERTLSKSGYGPDKKQAAAVKQFNQELRYVQGFSITTPSAGTTTTNITFLAPGKKLLGIAIIPGSATNLADSSFTLTVNNNNVCNSMGANNANPNFVGSMIFFPTPQPLSGNDTLKLIYTNGGALSNTIIVNFFYVPR